MRTAPSLVVALAGAALSCAPSAPKPAGSEPHSTAAVAAAAPGVVLPGPLRGTLVAEALYGGGKGAGAIAAWRPKRLWQVGGPAFDAATKFVASGVAILPFGQEGAIRAFVLATAAPAEMKCAGCGPVVGAALVTEGAGGWRVDAAEPEVGVWGDRGELTGDSRLVQAEAGRRLLMLLPEAEVEGRRSTSVVLVAERAGLLAPVLRIDEARASNEPSCGSGGGKPACWGWSFDWTMVHVTGQPAWDFELTRRGTRPNAMTGTIEEFGETRTWAWKGDRYEAVEGDSDDPK